LTPRVGFLSADSWTLLSTYLRNLLLNWLMLVPAVIALLLLPWVLLKAETALLGLRALEFAGREVPISYLVATAATACVWLAACLIYEALPRLDRDRKQPSYTPTAILIVLSAWLLSLLFQICEKREGGSSWTEVAFWGGGTLLVPLFLYWLTDFLAWRGDVKQGIHGAGRWKRSAFSLAGVVTAALLLLGAYKIAVKVPGRGDAGLLTLAIPVVLGLYMIGGTIMCGLRSSSETEEEREWWARSGAILFMISAGWLGFFGIAVYSVPILHAIANRLGVGTVPFTTLISGALGSYIGFSSMTPVNGGPDVQRLSRTAKFLQKAQLLVPALAVLFFVLLAMGLAWAGQSMVARFSARWWFLHGSAPREIIAFVLVIVALFGGALVLGWFLNVNTFSMHGLYRSRLIRAFLGASNRTRSPFSFINFDPDDNVYLAKLNVGARNPVHVINAALNLVHVTDLAWQERKAESFTFSKLHCGSYRVGYQPTFGYGSEQGVTLGTAMAISGAAASPNMGYNSSALVTLLLAFFNVRLGWWLANPRQVRGESGAKARRRWKENSPTFAFWPLVNEALGKTTDIDPWVYLSDGGHFDNLGLYEMAMRRVRTVVVVDASADPDFRRDDLANCCRKVFVDFGIPIDFERPIDITGAVVRDNRHCAVGTIHYEAVDGEGATPGTLIYIKSSLNGNEPEDVLNYARQHAAFPHEPTFDQWFSEAQFESYRQLGAHMVAEICADKRTMNAEGLVQAARLHVNRRPQALGTGAGG
jgi:hypothetical protein